MPGEPMSGGCACGRVRFEAEVESFDAYLCHCRMCQRASGNVSLAMFNLPQASVRWTGRKPIITCAGSRLPWRSTCAAMRRLRPGTSC